MLRAVRLTWWRRFMAWWVLSLVAVIAAVWCLVGLQLVQAQVCLIVCAVAVVRAWKCLP